MRIFATCLFVLLFLPVAGQVSKIDSLQRRLSETLPDTTRINVLNEIAYQYWSTDPSKTRDYAQQAMDLAKKANYLPGVARAHQGIGIYHWRSDQHAEAISEYEKARDIYQQLKDPAGMAKTSMNIGLVHKEGGNDVLALERYLEALALVQKEGGDIRTEANILNSIGVLYKNRQNFAEAKAYLEQAMTIWQKLGMKPNVAGAKNNLASLFAAQKKYDEALRFNRESLRLFEELTDVNGQIICHNNMGDFLTLTRDLESARTHYLTAIALNRTYGNKKLLVSSQVGLGTVLSKLRQYPAAVAYYDSAYALASAHKIMPSVEKAAAGLAEAHSGLRNYEKAYRYQKEYSTLKDSLFYGESVGQLASLRSAYENQKSQARIELLEKEESLAKATRNGLAIGLAALVIIAVLLLQQQQLKARKNKELFLKNQQLYETQRALTEVQLHNQELQTKRLQEELEFRNKSLTTHTLNLIQKNGIMEEIRETITDVLKSPRRDEHAPVYGRLIKLIDYSFSLDKDWEDFKMYFEQVHKGFFVKLKEKHPDLSSGELKMAALVRLNMNLKETATVMGISPDSVKTSRYRLRKKLNLEEEQNMTDYLMSLS
jgi:tetratricopeptide (TPR) repeat protein